MEKIRVELGERSYNIIIGNGMLKDIGKTLERFEFSKKAALISNPTVYNLYGKTVSESLKDSGYDLTEALIPDGEEYKSLAFTEKIYEALLKAKIDRKSALIALGGGVIGDITGFAASTYMRGIDFIQAPTTLLAQVDSSVGGKTGVNHPLGKNMIGAFWQPRLVWIDTATLETLPRREFLSGLGEVIKYGVIWDNDFFSYLETNRDKLLRLDIAALTYIIRRSCEIKAEVVSKDERESGLRAILNYGHTIGHAIETVTGYRKYLHGEAVAIGMYMEAKLSQQIGLIDNKEVLRIKALIASYGLPSEMPGEIKANDLIEVMRIDKKTIGGKMHFVLPEKAGSVRIHGHG
ncbi:MAG: 3-dehydroquinate synthase [Nitrospira bacterium HGW-Nitrospira-1]|nr:MAG: 3-dehydroquinate synthase [Nitrospira bacterium HGW-Nitrospira-1]